MTPKRFKKETLKGALKALSGQEYAGMVLRAKGIVQVQEGGWMQFDLVPGEYEIRDSIPDVTGRICVIGTGLNESGLRTLFGEG